MDANDNELAYLEAIHFFVEVLDSFFGNVCELDLVFNFYKVRGPPGGKVKFSCGEVMWEDGEGGLEWTGEADGDTYRSMPFWTRSSLPGRLRRLVSRWC